MLGVVCLPDGADEADASLSDEHDGQLILALFTLMNRAVRPLPKSRPREDDEKLDGWELLVRVVRISVHLYQSVKLIKFALEVSMPNFMGPFAH